MSEKLKIEYVDINKIKPSERNAKKHPAEQIEQIKKSITDYGMNDPIGVWRGEIVEGHGRVIACKELGIDKVPNFNREVIEWFACDNKAVILILIGEE